MESRVTTELVDFNHPFLLAARTAPLPAGRYRVEMEEELLGNLSFPAWRRTCMTIARFGLASGRLVQALPTTPGELAAALAADRAVTS